MTKVILNSDGSVLLESSKRGLGSQVDRERGILNIDSEKGLQNGGLFIFAHVISFPVTVCLNLQDLEQDISHSGLLISNIVLSIFRGMVYYGAVL